jgi:hypothetical protein
LKQALPGRGLAVEAVIARVAHSIRGTGALKYFEPVIDSIGWCTTRPSWSSTSPATELENTDGPMPARLAKTVDAAVS